MLDVPVMVAAPAVATLEPEDAHGAFTTLARAFAADPPSRWLFPDEHQYRHFFPAFAQAFGGAAIRDGTALATHDGSGVALWLAPGAGPDEDALAQLIERSVPERRRAGVFAVFDEMGRRHPTEPHWYLPLIGVEPAQQGRGLGAALLRPVLDECDAAQLPAYLEATSAASIPLYRRHGFEPLDEIRAGDCPPIVPMLRLPATGRAAQRCSN
jgi:GNAT superfamily N-acetyltransferase